MLRSFLAVAAVLLLPTLGLAQCLTTKAPEPPFVPPAPYPASPPAGWFWYGSDALWTALDNGKWSMDGSVLHGKGFRTKLTYWRKGFDWHKEQEPKLRITARRLDGDAPTVAVSHANAVFVTGNTPAMMTLIDIPTAGCWEIAARYHGRKLAFVVSVEP